jgi:filamentous hemagglutinin family protein
MNTLWQKLSWNSGLLLSLWAMPSWAQISPDASLGSRVVTTDRLNFTIEDGSRAGNNLFHSFSQFSIPTGGSANFNHAPDIQTIFTRITGPEASTIDGRLTANTNFYLLNPNGILFGPGAQLNLGGSFLATTADRINFADGLTFPSSNTTPLLSLSVPIGLQMGTAPAAIRQQGYGHGLATYNPILQPYGSIAPVPSLALRPQQTIALVGGEIDLTGGVLQSPEGRIDLASLGSNAAIALTDHKLGPITGLQNDIRLSQKSLLDVNGIGSGDIQLQGKNISLNGGALIWAQNRGPQAGGSIAIYGTESLTLNGTAPDLASVSSIINETVGQGDAGNIQVLAPNVTVQNGANLMSRSFSPIQGGKTGDISIQADRFQVSGYSPIVPDIFSAVASYTAGSGTGGNLQLTASQVLMLNGGSLGASTSGSGNAGSLVVNAERVEVSGLTSNSVASAINSPSLGGSGNAGNLTINARQLTLSQGGLVVASSLGAGNAGSVTINASESVEVLGVPGLDARIYQTAIASAVSPTQEPYTSIFRLFGVVPSGDSGDLMVTTPKLLVTDGALITVNNDGTGISGNLKVNTEQTRVDKTSYIAAGSFSGQGGNIFVTASRVLALNRQSRIYTSSNGIGNGGNINITAPILLGLNNSDIAANAVQGAGGQIKIGSQGIFGLQFRDRPTPGNDITASSEFGISGKVEIVNPGVDPNSGLVELPVDLADGSREIRSGCQSNQGSQFVVTGRGGTAIDPTQTFTTQTPWQDLRDNQVARKKEIMRSQPTILSEANTWERDNQGNIQLMASGVRSINAIATCAKAASHPHQN